MVGLYLSNFSDPRLEKSSLILSNLQRVTLVIP